ncbi:MAG: chemoreceptor glutamine deamidase CheD [Gammaproteobacteria bacterium]
MNTASDPTKLSSRVIPGFEGIKRYWDHKRQAFSAKLLPGEYYVTGSGEIITTVLGSCVAACMCDKALGIGGMNHFMLPICAHIGVWENTHNNLATRYGSVAMEHLINTIMKRGGKRKNLEVKLFGGASVLNTLMDIGDRNIQFVKDYVRTEGLHVVNEDLAGPYPRKVIYFPATGRALVKRLRSLHNDTIVQREQRYRHVLDEQPVKGDVDLF